MSEPQEREHVGRTIRKEIEIDASPEEVYEAWADPEGIAQWFVDRAEGRAESGSIVTWHFDTFGAAMPVPVLEAVAPSKLVIGGEIPGRPPFLQEVLVEHRGGRTYLRLANSGFGDGAEWDDEYEGVDSGWEMALATLAHWLEHGRRGPRTHLFASRPASFEYADLQPLFTTAEGLESWLAEEAHVEGGRIERGTPYRIALRGGGVLEGRAVARTGREVLLEWPEENALLALKAYARGAEGREVALDLNAWPLEGPGAEELGHRLEAALDRLAVRIGTSAS